jgi:hypothetical protein
LMLLERRHPRRAIFRIPNENLVAAHDAVFHLVNPLIGLGRAVCVG